MKEIEQPLWDRERKQAEPKVDIFHDQIVELRSSLKIAKKLRILTKRDDGNLYTAINSYDPDRPWQSKSLAKDSRAEAHVKKGTSTIFLAVNTYDADDKTRTSHYYQALESGTVVNLEMNMMPIERDSDEYVTVTNALNAVQRGVTNAIDRKRDSLSERRKVARNIGVTAAGLALVGGGITFGVRKLFVEPAEANEAYRHVYDHTNHLLPGDGVVVASHSFGLISPSALDAIPTYGGSDRDFSHPRRESLDYSTGCDSVTTKILGGTTLYASVANTSPIKYDHFNVSKTDDGFEICLAEEVPSQTSGNDLDIAIQIR